MMTMTMNWQCKEILSTLGLVFWRVGRYVKVATGESLLNWSGGGWRSASTFGQVGGWLGAHVCSLLGEHNYIAPLYLHGVAERRIGFQYFANCLRHPDVAVVAQ